MKSRRLFGPPGTGKTTALLEELDRELASGVPPERIAFMTFTVAARREAVSRATERFGFDRERMLHFRTIHSAAFKQMNVPRSAIVTPDKIFDLQRTCNVRFSRRAVGDYDTDAPLAGMLSSSEEGDRLMAFDHLRRHRMQTLERAMSSWRGRPVIAEHFTKSYRAWKKREGLYDFTDMLTHAREPLPVDVVFIDEAQDLSKLQWSAARRLCSNAERLYVAGDDDQAIFEWAGADPEAFLSMKSDEDVVLGRSFRVPARIHGVAAAVVKTIRHRRAKEWRPREEEGFVRWETEPDHWEPDETGTTFVLARNRRFLSSYEDRLRSLGIAYDRSDRDRSIHHWARPVVAWERWRRSNDREDLDEARPAIMHENTSRDDPWFEALTRIPTEDRLFIRAILRRSGNEGLLERPRVTLSTIHAVKGREADHVVMDCGMSPSSRRELLDGDGDSEARVTYVGVTRARNTFTLVGVGHPLIPVELLGGDV